MNRPRARSTRFRGGAGRLGLLIGLAGFSAAGCDLFHIREPIPPVSESACPRHSPASVDSVVFNFESGVSCKVAGSRNLLDALGAPFTFVLDPLDVGGGAQRPDSMNKTVTLAGFDAYFQSPAGRDSLVMAIHYQLLPPERNIDLPDGRRWFDNVGYELLRYDSTAGTLKGTIAGVADIYLRPASGSWTFDRWVDQATGGATPSLGAVLGDLVGR